VEFHQGGLASFGSFADSEHFFVVHSPIAVLYQLNRWTLQLHGAEHYLAGHEIGQPVGHSHAWKVEQQFSARVTDDQILESQVVEEGSRDRADLYLSGHDAVEPP
jgi:hypothetical protein